jgi:hypothetical protein
MLLSALGGTAVYADMATGTGAFAGAAATIAGGTLGVCGSSTCSTFSIPYWLNPSSDGAGLAGYNFLNAQGAFAGQTNYVGSSGMVFLSGSGNGSPASFNFIRQAGSMSISLLYANSSGVGGAEVGIYDASTAGGCTLVQNAQGISGCSAHQVLGNLPANISGTVNADTGSPLSVFNGTSNYANWGFYARTCQTALCAGAFGITTYYDNVAADQFNPALCPQCASMDASHQHWALWQSGANPNTYFLALEDWAFGYSGSTISPNEGTGDYNDLIFQITTSISAAPEPGTLSIVGFGLVALAAIGRKFRK